MAARADGSLVHGSAAAPGEVVLRVGGEALRQAALALAPSGERSAHHEALAATYSKAQ